MANSKRWLLFASRISDRIVRQMYGRISINGSQRTERTILYRTVGRLGTASKSGCQGDARVVTQRWRMIYEHGDSYC